MKSVSENLYGKVQRVMVIGAGVSGRAAARLLLREGAQVCMADDEPFDTRDPDNQALQALGVELGSVNLDLVNRDWDLAVISPGVGRDSTLVRHLESRNVPIIGEIELAWQCSDYSLVAVTGTNGKTTTVRLTESVLGRQGEKTLGAGNIGLPFSSVVLERQPLDHLVLELSSFQLERSVRFRPAVAVLLNLSPDHLDRHQTYEAYCLAKAKLFERQQEGDRAVIQWEAKETLERLGVRFRPDTLTFSSQNAQADLFFERGEVVTELWNERRFVLPSQLVGVHNAENMMAALLIGYVLGKRLPTMLESLERFRGEAHRMEVLPSKQDVVLINDSKSTNPDSLRAALAAAKELGAPGGRLWLIAGGVSKRLSFWDLALVISANVEKVFLFGRDRREIAAALGGFGEPSLYRNLDAAAHHALQCARPGDVVLFSPGCASFDQFSGYVERGERFRSLVADWQAQSAAGSRRRLSRRSHAVRNQSLPAARSATMRSSFVH